MGAEALCKAIPGQGEVWETKEDMIGTMLQLSLLKALALHMTGTQIGSCIYISCARQWSSCPEKAIL